MSNSKLDYVSTEEYNLCNLCNDNKKMTWNGRKKTTNEKREKKNDE